MLRKRIQLGLIHVAVAMTLVPINSTLNRVMIKELALSASLVAIFASLPYLFSPLQVAIGAFSDRYPLWGYRRTPYILLGLLLCVSGVMLSPYAAFLLAQDFTQGVFFAMLTFAAWGMGFNFASVSYLSLASELSGERGRGRTIAVMWFMMIASIVLTAVLLGRLVEPYSPQMLQRAFAIVGCLAMGLGLLGVIRLEPRFSTLEIPREAYSWKALFAEVMHNSQARLFFVYLTLLLAAILGQDILLEPFAAEALAMRVDQTTRITSLWGVCVLLMLLLAGLLEGRLSKRLIAQVGAWLIIGGFSLIASGGWLARAVMFYSGVILLGLGTGLATVSNLALMLEMTTPEKIGLYIGAWGMSNAISRLLGSMLGGGLRDVLTQVLRQPLAGYVVVFILEAAMVLGSVLLLQKISVDAFQHQAKSLSLVERAATANEVS